MEIEPKRYKQIRELALEYHRLFQTRNALIVFSRQKDINCSVLNLTGDLGGFVHMGLHNGIDACHVYINAKYDLYSQKIIAAHELGHIVLHRHDLMNMFAENNKESEQIREYEANVFAMEFMSYIQPQQENYLNYSKEELQQFINSKLFFKS